MSSIDFARFFVPHPRNQYQKVDGALKLEKIDETQMNFFPNSFFDLIRSSYHFTKSYVAASITPPADSDSSDRMEKPKMLLAAAGFIIKNAIKIYSSHLEFIDHIIKSDRETKEKLAALNENNLSFGSMKFKKIVKIIDEYFESNGEDTHPLVLLFMTDVGFCVYYHPEIDWNANLQVGVVLSQAKIFQINPHDFQVTIRTPKNDNVKNMSASTPRIICDFSLIEGHWQPSFKSKKLTTIIPDIKMDVFCSRDGLSCDLSKFSAISSRCFGLIGRYSDILKIFDQTHYSKDRPALESMRVYLSPVMFFHKMQTGASSYVILYLPNDFMPNHPQYVEVTQFAYAFMRRACGWTFFVPNPDQNISDIKVNNQVQGILKRADDIETFCFGSGKTQLITVLEHPAVLNLTFQSITDLINWFKWIEPYYSIDYTECKFKAIAVDSQTSICIDGQTLNILIKNYQYASMAKTKHPLDNILFGKYGNRKVEDIANAQMVSTEFHPTIPTLLETSVNLISSALEACPKRPCAVCEHPRYLSLSDEDKQDMREDNEIDNLCDDCVFLKYENNRELKKRHDFEEKKEIQRIFSERKKIFKQRFGDLTSIYFTCDQNQCRAVKFFISWLFKYWTKLCLEYHWEDLKKRNYCQLADFDHVDLNEDGTIKSLIQALQTLKGKVIKENSEDYFSVVEGICINHPVEIKKDQLLNCFRMALIEKNKEWYGHETPMDYKTFCNNIDGMKRDNSTHKEYGNVAIQRIKVSEIRINSDLKVTINASSLQNMFKQYTFYSMFTANDESYSAEPLQSKCVATLIEQPPAFEVVNAWCVAPGALVLTKIGKRLALILLPNGFSGRFVKPDHFIYQIEISNIEEKLCVAEFAPTTNIILILCHTEKDFYFNLIQLSLDFKTATLIRKRPLRFLLPLPLNRDNGKPQVHGFIINQTASHGVIGLTIHNSEEDVQKIVDFNPTTLTYNSFVDKSELNLELYPLHFMTTENTDDSIVICSPKPDEYGLHSLLVLKPNECQIARVPLNGYDNSIRNRIGVSEYNNNPILMLNHKNQPPQLQISFDGLPSFLHIDDMFQANLDCTSIPLFVANCIQSYGLSEVERIFFPTKKHYPTEIVKIEVLNLDSSNENINMTSLFKGSKNYLSSIIPYPWAVPVYFANIPPKHDLYDLLTVAETRNRNKASIINLLMRMFSIPQTMVSNITKVDFACSDYLKHSIRSTAVQFMSKFPPFTGLRSTSQRNALVFSLVDIGESDGSSIFSSLTGVPFTPSPKGTFRMGSNFIPIFNDSTNLFTPDGFTINKASIDHFDNIIAATIKPGDSSSSIESSICIYTALSFSDLVIINAGKSTKFLMKVLEELISINFTELIKIDQTLYKLNEDDVIEINETPKIAIITDLGNNPVLKIKEMNSVITKALSMADGISPAFSGECMFIPSSTPTFEIAKAIADKHITALKDNMVENQKLTIDAMQSVQEAAGYFGSYLAHIDMLSE